MSSDVPHIPALENKVIPAVLHEEAVTALSYYPQLDTVPIEFRFKRSIKKSFMQAQPKLTGIWRSRRKREYIIFINEQFNIENEVIPTHEVPRDVLIGWLGHELGHVMDYQEHSTLGMILFGLRYISSPRYIREAERMADTYAIRHNMADYIIQTKNFILNHTHFSEAYKNRIRRLYLSPEEIMTLVEEHRIKEVERMTSTG